MANPFQIPDGQLFFKFSEVARIFGVHRSTVARSRGDFARLRHVMLGAKPVVPRDDVIAMIEHLNRGAVAVSEAPFIQTKPRLVKVRRA